MDSLADTLGAALPVVAPKGKEKEEKKEKDKDKDKDKEREKERAAVAAAKAQLAAQGSIRFGLAYNPYTLPEQLMYHTKYMQQYSHHTARELGRSCFDKLVQSCACSLRVLKFRHSVCCLRGSR